MAMVVTVTLWLGHRMDGCKQTPNNGDLHKLPGPLSLTEKSQQASLLLSPSSGARSPLWAPQHGSRLSFCSNFPVWGGSVPVGQEAVL